MLPYSDETGAAMEDMAELAESAAYDRWLEENTPYPD
jgi:hypothetical protein